MTLNPSLAQSLVGRLLILNPRERATVRNALDGPWIARDRKQLEAAYVRRCL